MRHWSLPTISLREIRESLWLYIGFSLLFILLVVIRIADKLSSLFNSSEKL